MSLLEVRGLSCAKDAAQMIFSGVTLVVNEGDVVCLQGKSGSGKTTFLKCLAHLNLYEGEVRYRGRTPQSYGIPNYRTRVSYVPQRPAVLPGTPRDFLESVRAFASRGAAADASSVSRRSHRWRRGIEISGAWGVDEHLWDREWSNLSGGESQRVALALTLGLDTAEVLLLDEPTSALDTASCALVEETLLKELRDAHSALKAIVWITHSEEQASRVGTRFVAVSREGFVEDRAPPV